MKGIS